MTCQGRLPRLQRWSRFPAWVLGHVHNPMDTGTGTTTPSPFPCPAAAAGLLEGLRDAPRAKQRDAKSRGLQAQGRRRLTGSSAGLLHHTDSLEASCFLSANVSSATATEGPKGVPCSTGGGEQVPPGGTSQTGQRRDRTGAGSGPHDQQRATQECGAVAPFFR